MSEREAIQLTEEKIDEIFQKAWDNPKEGQFTYWIGLYRHAFHDWDDIKSIDGYPVISEKTSLYIFDKAIKFDKVHHPNVFAGGLWMNKGFATRKDAEDWVIVFDECKVEFGNKEDR